MNKYNDDHGVTLSEIVHDLDVDIEEAASIIDELLSTGMVVDSGLRRPGRDGEPEIAWFVTPEGKLAVNFGSQ